MPYTGRERGSLTGQELEVKEALHFYYPDINSDSRIWTPLTVLYAAYLRHWQACKKRGWRRESMNGVLLSPPVDPKPLRLNQFGRVIRRVFPNASKVRRVVREAVRTLIADDPQRVTLRTRWRVRWGYTLAGPMALHSHTPRGGKRKNTTPI